MPKTYRGYRQPEGHPQGGGCVVTVDGKPLDPRLDLWNHSPTGFEWGYAGSGPAQLALAILADLLGDDEQAVLYHQAFKFEFVTHFPHEGWVLEEEKIRQWMLTVPES